MCVCPGTEALGVRVSAVFTILLSGAALSRVLHLGARYRIVLPSQAFSSLDFVLKSLGHNILTKLKITL